MEQALKKLGVFREIGPELLGFSKSFGLEEPILDSSSRDQIRRSILDDLQNKNLQELISRHQKVYWRIPNSQFLFWNGLGLLYDVSRYDSSLQGIEVLSSRPEYYGTLMRKVGFNQTVCGYEDSRIRDVKEELMVRVPSYG